MLQKTKKYLLGQGLIERQFLRPERLEVALKEQQRSGQALGDCLLASGDITEAQLLEVLADQYDLEVMNLKSFDIPKDILERVPARIAQHYLVIPVGKDAHHLHLVMHRPPRLEALQELTAILGSSIKVFLAETKQIQETLERSYGIGASIVEKLVASKEIRSSESNLILGSVTEETDVSANESSVRDLVNQLFIDALSKRASDIHMEPFPGELIIRYRIDGILYEANTPKAIKQFYPSIISRIKIMAQLDIAEQRRPQDGRIKIRVEQKELDLRISLLPTAFGEAIVIRILAQTRLLNLDTIGLSKENLSALRQVIAKPHGMILLTGPTGSGKTTTLYSCLNELNQIERKIITVEDPVEYQIRGLVQMQVNPKISVTFATGLRHMLRHDPDVMMVGEIRDAETAEIAVRSALTGHLVFSTLHTNDAPSAVARLIDLGIPPYLVASSLICVVAQRLVRKVCPHCRTESRLDEMSGYSFEKLLETNHAKEKFYQGKGCPICRETGYLGRTSIHEIMVLNEEICEAITHNASTAIIREKALANGLTELREDGIKKAILGETALSEIIRVTR